MSLRLYALLYYVFFLHTSKDIGSEGRVQLSEGLFCLQGCVPSGIPTARSVQDGEILLHGDSLLQQPLRERERVRR